MCCSPVRQCHHRHCFPRSCPSCSWLAKCAFSSPRGAQIIQNMKFSAAQFFFLFHLSRSRAIWEDWTNTRLFSIAFPTVNIFARQLLYYVITGWHYKHVCYEQQFLNDPSPRVSCLLCTFTFINEMKNLVTVSRNQIKSELLFTTCQTDLIAGRTCRLCFRFEFFVGQICLVLDTD